MHKKPKIRLNVWDYLCEYSEMRDDILAAVDRVFSSGQLILGEHVANFEREFAAYIGTAGGVGVNSGTDALHLGLVACDIGPGDDVITVPNTAVPTVSAIVTAGARPVFIDVNPDDYLIDVDQIADAITPSSKAIIPVHLYGQCADMDPLMNIAGQHELFVLEDCAQSAGARYKGRQSGSLANASAFSFYPTKLLSAYGDGGWIGSDDESYLALVRSLRMYGMEGSYYSERHGFNSRLDEVQAAILSIKLVKLETWIDRRREIAAYYTRELAATGLKVPSENAHNRHAYYVYVVEHPDRDAVMRRLTKFGINCNVSYPYPIHTMRGYSNLNYREGQFPVAEEKAKRIFSLPMHPHLTDEDTERIVDAVKEVV